MVQWSDELEEDKIRFPYRARHATMFSVTEQELLRLLDKYALLAQYRTPTYSPVRVAAEESEGFFHDGFAMRSIAMHIRPNSITGTQVLFDEGDSMNGLALRIREGRLEAAVCSNGHRFQVSGELLQLKLMQWNHTAMTYDEGRKLSLYVNGLLAGEGSAPFALVRAHDCSGGYGGRFGTDAFGDQGNKAAFDGGIKNVQIYSVPLHMEDIRAMTASQ